MKSYTTKDIRNPKGQDLNPGNIINNQISNEKLHY